MSFAELLQQARVMEDVLEEACAAAAPKKHAPTSAAPLPPQLTERASMTAQAHILTN